MPNTAGQNFTKITFFTKSHQITRPSLDQAQSSYFIKIIYSSLLLILISENRLE